VSAGLIGAFFIRDSRTVAIPSSGQAVDADDGCAGLPVGLGLCGEVAEVGGDNEETGRQIGAEFVEVHQFFGVVIVRIAEHQAITVGESHIFGSADGGREERIVHDRSREMR
jgi:hypothetical protein